MGNEISPLNSNKSSAVMETPVRDQFIDIITKTNRFHGKMAHLVREVVSQQLMVTDCCPGAVASITQNVIHCALEAAEEIGLGLATTMKSIACGIIMGVHDTRGDIVLAAVYSFKCAVEEAAVIGGDVVQIARATSDGILEANTKITGNTDEIAKVLVNEALGLAFSRSQISWPKAFFDDRPRNNSRSNMFG